MNERAEAVRLSDPVQAGSLESDQALADRIQVKLTERGLLRDARVEVDSVGGVVTLRGAVGSATERALMGAISRTVQGVRAVNNLLRVE